MIHAIQITQPTLVSRPFHRAGWVHEEKVDGYRMVAHKNGNAVQLISRQGTDFTRRFPELAAAIRALRFRSLILDGELARYDGRLISRFEWLRASPKYEIATPPMFMGFDCLRLDEGDLRSQSLRGAAALRAWRECWWLTPMPMYASSSSWWWLARRTRWTASPGAGSLAW